MTDFVGHFVLFTVVAILALLVPLVVGYFVRPRLPTPEKDAVYECGEPTIGSSYVQFDLRFYVVALLFIIFDVEVAFFFPWSLPFGSSVQLADTRITQEAREVISAKMLSVAQVAPENVVSAESAQMLAAISLVDVLVFFAVLLVGFAYVWKRGDLDWVRSVAQEVQLAAARPKPPPAVEQRREPQTVA